MSSAGPGPNTRQRLSQMMQAADSADRARNFPRSIEICGQILSIDPDFLPARILSAVSHYKAGHWEAAEAKLKDILKTHPNNFASNLWLATVLAKTGRFAQAAPLAARAIAINPENKDAHLLFASSLFEQGELEQAEMALRETLALNEGIGEANAMLGSVLQQLGNLPEAERLLLRAIELEPLNGPPYYELVQGRKMISDDRPLIGRFESASVQTGLRARDKSRIEYALGKAYNDLHEYEQAIGHYDEANRLALQEMNSSGLVFNPIQTADDFARAESSAAKLSEAPCGSDSETPIFVLGMMRSGTTLVEQIVSSHSQVAAAGEQNFWLSRVAPFFEAERLPNEREAKEFAVQYLKLLGQFSGGRPRVTDKQPHNFIALGMIHSVFPNARIIHCRRNLVDCCLSIYMTPFRQSPDFGHSRENIVYFAKLYSQLMAFWRRTLPSDRFMEVDYEDLVADTETVVRKMIDFLGLPWEDACLSHESNTRDVRTPSLWQVRQKIYKSSVERWRNYEPWLGVFKELFAIQED